MMNRMGNVVKGFTLVELMVTLVVLAILATMAVPAMSQFFDKRRVIEAAEDLYANLQYARVEAIARSAPVYVRFNSGGAVWQYGISINDTCDLTKTDPTEDNADACVLIVDDGDGVLDDGTATIDDSDVVLHRYTNQDYTDVSMTLTTMPTNNQIQFEANRGTTAEAVNTEVTLTSDGGKQLKLFVGFLGGVRICSPAGSANIAGYTSGC